MDQRQPSNLEMLTSVEERGYVVPRVRRAFGLDWEEGEDVEAWFAARPEAQAVLKVIHLFPWMIDVAELGFDERVAEVHLQREAVSAQMRLGDVELALACLGDLIHGDEARKLLGMRLPPGKP